jgi:CBS domain containing-hemolysin-like protein
VTAVFLIYAGGHFIPELLTTIKNKRYIVFSLKLLVYFHLLMKPLLFPISYIIRKIEANENSSEEVDENERSVHARAYIESGKEKGFFLSDEEELLHSVVEFSDITVKEVMTPRVDMNYMHRDMPLVDAVALVKEHNKSRYPVYSKNIDDIIGIINIKEMFILWDSDDKKITIKDLASLEPYFVPESKMVDDLLREMRQRHLKMCIVVDEYGGTAGLVTLEDLVEEIVGEIQDEYEDEENDIVENSDGSYTVLGKTDIDELEDLLGRSLEDESYETIGGMIFSELGRVPRVKEKINVKGLEITILAVDGRKIEKVIVRKK